MSARNHRWIVAGGKQMCWCWMDNSNTTEGNTLSAFQRVDMVSRHCLTWCFPNNIIFLQIAQNHEQHSCTTRFSNSLKKEMVHHHQLFKENARDTSTLNLEYRGFLVYQNLEMSILSLFNYPPKTDVRTQKHLRSMAFPSTSTGSHCIIEIPNTSQAE